jgi:flagellar basal-body rod modification protein FlgD
MSQIPSALNSTAGPSFSTSRAVNDLDLDTFLKLMITELQNQDPLNPLDNKDMLAQISQLREVGATDKLTQTLESVLLGQNIASATNLIGADIAALSDDGENVDGVVTRVSIQDGLPRLHIDRSVLAAPAIGEGGVEAGTYNYQIVWEDDEGMLFGIELSGEDGVTTTGTEGIDQAIQLSNLPITTGPKAVYRSDVQGEGPYRLVGNIINGSQGTFVDRLSDEERSELQLTRAFQRSTHRTRSYEVRLTNVSAIRPPGLGAGG